MAHPVRPDSYVEINNFYTTTVYNKGAEVIRMLQTLLGRERFIAGVRLYLQRHDGRAATCDDFVAAMEAAGRIDLSRFKRWYSQAGTPVVTIEQDYDPQQGTLTLTLTQSCPATPGQPAKRPFQIPFALGLLDREGRDIPLLMKGEDSPGPATRVLNLTEEQETFTLTGMPHRPVVSPLRGFSAPVRVVCDFSPEQLALRMARDSDPFNRWEAAQLLATRELLELYRQGEKIGDGGLSETFCAAWGQALNDEQVDMSLLSQLLTLPSEQFLADHLDSYDPGAIRRLRDAALRQLAQEQRPALVRRYRQCRERDAGYSLATAAVGRRSLQNVCLRLLLMLDEQSGEQLALDQYAEAGNMTDRLAAFAALVDSRSAQRQEILDDFYRQWRRHPLLLDKWFSIQALGHRDTTFEEVQHLLGHADFSLATPNRVRALLGAFSQNLGVFHRSDGAGYRLLVDQLVKLDRSNPQVAARLATPLTRWRRLEPIRRDLLRRELERLQQTELSRDLYEIVNKSLEQ